MIPCHEGVYSNEAAVRKLYSEIQDLKIPHEAIPSCPRCGAPMENHLRIDHRFVEDEAWRKAKEAYVAHLEEMADKKILLLELGVGYNTPTIIRYLFEQLLASLPSARLIRLNAHDSAGLPENQDKTVIFTEEMEEVVTRWQDI